MLISMFLLAYNVDIVFDCRYCTWFVVFKVLTLNVDVFGSKLLGLILVAVSDFLNSGVRDPTSAGRTHCLSS